MKQATKVAQKDPKEIKVQIVVRMPKSLDREIERIAYERDTTKQSLIEQALRNLVSEAA